MISSYSPLIEILVALNGAFAFVEPSENYSRVLSKYIFKRESVDVLSRRGSFRSLSIWCFLFCIFTLFLCGLESQYFVFSRICFCCMGLVSFGLLFLGWLFGERPKKNCCLAVIDFSKPMDVIVAFFVYLFISFLCGVFIPSDFLDIGKEDSLPWYLVSVFFIILPSFNFIVYFIKVGLRIKREKKD
ncbi:MAG: hypothetical protein LBH12_04315 [Dysgonamonadaceae bacterium]|jgi:hypothetical protein|nr:hypothetical protein [Dysgonamonadaceae bacterium]